MYIVFIFRLLRRETRQTFPFLWAFCSTYGSHCNKLAIVFTTFLTIHSNTFVRGTQVSLTYSTHFNNYHSMFSGVLNT